jgi:hypothetical protein
MVLAQAGPDARSTSARAAAHFDDGGACRGALVVACEVVPGNADMATRDHRPTTAIRPH